MEEALNLLEQVCAGYRGTLQEHQALQTALQTVKTKCSEKPVSSEKPVKKGKVDKTEN